MVKVEKYNTIEERNQIVKDNENIFYLWEEDNFGKDNSLTFVDRPRVDSEPIPKE